MKDFWQNLRNVSFSLTLSYSIVPYHRGFTSMKHCHLVHIGDSCLLLFNNGKSKQQQAFLTLQQGLEPPLGVVHVMLQLQPSMTRCPHQCQCRTVLTGASNQLSCSLLLNYSPSVHSALREWWGKKAGIEGGGGEYKEGAKGWRASKSFLCSLEGILNGRRLFGEMTSVGLKRCWKLSLHTEGRVKPENGEEKGRLCCLALTWQKNREQVLCV